MCIYIYIHIIITKIADTNCYYIVGITMTTDRIVVLNLIVVIVMRGLQEGSKYMIWAIRAPSSLERAYFIAYV